MNRPWLGVVADDVTGACDLADAVCAEGHSAVVTLGVPDRIADCDCAVVALKSRTAPPAVAVAESVAAAQALLGAGCTTIYQKYCSTFDSTDEGNIGPVADALRASVGRSRPAIAVGTPATPRVERTVYQGHLFVGRQLLSASSMRDHPLTPMRDADLVAVLGRQTSDAVQLVPRSAVVSGADAVVAAIESAAQAGAGHLVLDALDDHDLDVAAVALHRLQSAGRDVVIGGAAGLAAALARTREGGAPGDAARAVPHSAGGRQLIVSGSCSTRTREQIAAFDGPCIELSPLDLAADATGTIDAVLGELRAAFDSSPVLVSSSAAPDRVRSFDQRLGVGRAAELLELAAGEIAARAVTELGVRQLLVAGGETSGAVMQALGIYELRVGPAVEPGLPWMVPTCEGAPVLLLKSGNFGAPELFRTAWRCLP